MCKIHKLIKNKYNFLAREIYYNKHSVPEKIKQNPETISYNRGMYLFYNFSIKQNLVLWDIPMVLEGLELLLFLNKDITYITDLEEEEKNYCIKKIKKWILENKIREDGLDLLFKDYDNKSNNILDFISNQNIYYEPRNFSEESAYKCGLIPFSFLNKNLLAVDKSDKHSSIKLDAYQALTGNSIPKNSELFTIGNDISNIIDKDTLEQIFTSSIDNSNYSQKLAV